MSAFICSVGHMNEDSTMKKRTAFGLGGYRHIMRSDKEILVHHPLRIKTQYET
jgi:hypothetical protein